MVVSTTLIVLYSARIIVLSAARLWMKLASRRKELASTRPDLTTYRACNTENDKERNIDQPCVATIVNSASADL